MVQAEADIARDLDVHGQHAARLVRPKLHPAAHVTPVAGRLHVLASRGRPAHGALEPSREHGHQRVFLIHGYLGAESPAHAPGHEMDLLGLELQALGDLIAHGVRGLRVAPHGQLLRLVVPDRAAGPRLHAQGQHALVHHVELEDDVRGLETGVDAVLLDLERDGKVGAGLGIEQRRPRLERLLSVDHDGQRLVASVAAWGDSAATTTTGSPT